MKGKKIAIIVILAILCISTTVTIIIWTKPAKANTMVYYLEDHKNIVLEIEDGKYRFSGSGPMWDIIENVFDLEGNWSPSLIEEDLYCSDSVFTPEGEGQFVFIYTEKGLCVAKTPARDMWLNFVERD